MKSNRCHRTCHVLILCATLFGCEQTAKDSAPSYAELVVTYNAELETLDRLEAKREKLVAQRAAALAPKTSGNTLSKLEGLLRSTNNLNDGTDFDTTSDPDALLDRLTDRNGEAQEIAGQLLDGLLGGELTESVPEPRPDIAAALALQKTEHEAELEALDTEINKQRERVGRARAARDATEARD